MRRRLLTSVLVCLPALLAAPATALAGPADHAPDARPTPELPGPAVGSAPLDGPPTVPPDGPPTVPPDGPPTVPPGDGEPPDGGNDGGDDGSPAHREPDGIPEEPDAELDGDDAPGGDDATGTRSSASGSTTSPGSTTSTGEDDPDDAGPTGSPDDGAGATSGLRLRGEVPGSVPDVDEVPSPDGSAVAEPAPGASEDEPGNAGDAGSQLDGAATAAPTHTGVVEVAEEARVLGVRLVEPPLDREAVDGESGDDTAGPERPTTRPDGASVLAQPDESGGSGPGPLLVGALLAAVLLLALRWRASRRR